MNHGLLQNPEFIHVFFITTSTYRECDTNQPGRSCGPAICLASTQRPICIGPRRKAQNPMLAWPAVARTPGSPGSSNMRGSMKVETMIGWTVEVIVVCRAPGRQGRQVWQVLPSFDLWCLRPSIGHRCWNPNYWPPAPMELLPWPLVELGPSSQATQPLRVATVFHSTWGSWKWAVLMASVGHLRASCCCTPAPARSLPAPWRLQEAPSHVRLWICHQICHQCQAGNPLGLQWWPLLLSHILSVRPSWEMARSGFMSWPRDWHNIGTQQWSCRSHTAPANRCPCLEIMNGWWWQWMMVPSSTGCWMDNEQARQKKPIGWREMMKY